MEASVTEITAASSGYRMISGGKENDRLEASVTEITAASSGYRMIIRREGK